MSEPEAAAARRDRGAEDRDDDHDRPTPAVVVGAVAAGVVPVPFLVVYAGLFLIKGLIVRADRPEITSSHWGEALAGLIALVLFAVVVSGLMRLHSGHGALVHLVAQTVVLAGAVRFLVVTSSGDPEIPVLLLMGAVVSIGLTLTPTSRRFAPLPSRPRRAGPSAPQAPETGEPETDAPDTDEPETDAPDTHAPDTHEMETDAPETAAADDTAVEPPPAR